MDTQDTGEWWIRPAASARLIVLQCSPGVGQGTRSCQGWIAILPSASAGGIDRRAVVRVASKCEEKPTQTPPHPKRSKGLVLEIRVHTSLIAMVLKWQVGVTPPGTALIFLAAVDSLVPMRRVRGKGLPPMRLSLLASRFSNQRQAGCVTQIVCKCTAAGTATAQAGL